MKLLIAMPAHKLGFASDGVAVVTTPCNMWQHSRLYPTLPSALKLQRQPANHSRTAMPGLTMADDNGGCVGPGVRQHLLHQVLRHTLLHLPLALAVRGREIPAQALRGRGAGLHGCAGGCRWLPPDMQVRVHTAPQDQDAFPS